MKRTSFIFLNLTQFFSALNDNIYKLLLVFQLIAIQGMANSNTILSLAGAIFVLPFLLFAALAGSLADRYSKKSIIVITRLIELFVISLGVLAFFLKSAILGYSVLFMMAIQSTLFSPAKYGIIPEIVKKEEISKFNGILTATTYLAIILGTFFASFLSEITGKNFLFASFFCILIAVLGAFTSFGIEKTKAQASDKKVSTRFLSDIYRTLKKASSIRYLLPAIVFGAYFLFLGAYVQLNMIPFALQSLQLSELQGGYLFIMTAIGIGIGSYLAGKVSGKEVELGLVPLAAFAIFFLLMGLYTFQTNFYIDALILIMLGFCGGFYIVPIDAFIQMASPNENRGENLAAANFLNFFGVVIASALLYLFGNIFQLTAAEGFFALSGLTLLLALSLFFLMGDQVFRFFLVKVLRPFWNLKVTGHEKIRAKHPIVFIGKRTSWLDTLVMMAILPRFIRIIVPMNKRYRKTRSFAYRLIKLIPIEEDIFNQTALQEIKKELRLHHSLCILFPDKDPPTFNFEMNHSVEIQPLQIHAPKNLKGLFSLPIQVDLFTKN